MSSVSPVRAPHPLLTVLGGALERVLNAAIDLDPETRSRLADLDGRAVTLDLGGTSTPGAAPALRIAVEGDQVRVGPAFQGASALHVAATPGSLLSLVFARGGDGGLPPGRLQIAGDAELARRLEHIATRFAPDFDEAFARAFGDVVGFQLARSLRRALAWSQRSARAFANDTAEFLTEEGRDLVPKPELEQFLDDVDQLRERADRLAARLQRLHAAHGLARA